MVRVKICGITNIDDALAAVDFGTDALGFVFYKGSPRYIEPSAAGKIIENLPPFITTVGVFVDLLPQDIKHIVDVAGLNVVQFHGDETPEACRISHCAVKAIRVESIDSLEPLQSYRDLVSAFLLDTFTPETFGGTGQKFNWDIAVEAKQFGRIILAGGLTSENIADAVRHVRPYAVDVSSGVEASKGRKDHQKMKLFIEKAKAA